MDVYRARIQHWRTVEKLGFEITDVTVKSGMKQFGPDWDALRTYKDSKKTVDDIAIFEMLYLEKMNLLWRVAPEEFDKLVRQKTLVLSCYCDQENAVYCHVETLLKCVEKVCKGKKTVSYTHLTLPTINWV